MALIQIDVSMTPTYKISKKAPPKQIPPEYKKRRETPGLSPNNEL